ncbi:FeoB-associated Cys-rich membrane protein [Butyricicoccus faecihominis]|nr:MULTISPECIES: FeoB-associated Cys-rich membrane protein [Butyricicoccaceae]MCQ5130375.1 FeoB-associated Cys-rich membrane protein [Butyricicoccus faecihominis]WNX83808.1 FeoB-associated Cys-rich membrane protein [Agathobaculum sp. NTUH-O15-33]
MIPTIIVSALLLAAVFFAFRKVRRQVKNGECPGGCAGCSHQCACHGEKK